MFQFWFKIEPKYHAINEDLLTFMTNSVNSVTIDLTLLPCLPRLSVFLLLLWLRERALIAVLTLRNILHLIWLVRNEDLRGFGHPIKYRTSEHAKKYEMGEACGTYGESRGAYRVLAGISEGKRPLGRYKCRWKDNIKMYVPEVKWGT